MVTYCGDVRYGFVCNFELLPLLHMHIYLSVHSIITITNTTPSNAIIKHVCINCRGLRYEYNLQALLS